ncbi:U3 small nucleolar ribonucleoprotein IMP4-like [Lampetra planeri]
MVMCHLPLGPTAYFTLSSLVMRHDIPDVGTMSEAFPHLVMHNFTSGLGKREDSRRIITLAKDDDYISFRHHVYKRDGKDIELKEVGP